MKNLLLLIVLGLFLSSCKNENDIYQDINYLREVYSQPDSNKWPAPTLDSLIDKSTFKDIGTLGEAKHPEYNPYSKAKKQLGKMLFFDARLSQTGQIACASCHNPELTWTDNITRSLGHDRQNNNRNSMTIKNVAFAHTLFWDGRAKSLEHQASFPISDAIEMNTESNVAVRQIAEVEGYKPLFEDAFGDPEVNLDRILKAIATYERTLVSRNSKFDRFINGKRDLFTDEEVKGLHIFRTKARCINCHNTPYFSDNQFHNDGQALFGAKDEDFGRYKQTQNKDDLGRFKTPTLREVSKTGPWMHHGHFPSLLDVVEYYNLGNPAPIQNKYLGVGRDSLIPITSPILKKLDLTKNEIDALIAFMETLSTRTQRVNLVKMPE